MLHQSDVNNCEQIIYSVSSFQNQISLICEQIIFKNWKIVYLFKDLTKIMICSQIFLNFHAHDKITDVKIWINNGLQLSHLFMASEYFWI